MNKKSDIKLGHLSLLNFLFLFNPEFQTVYYKDLHELCLIKFSRPHEIHETLGSNLLVCILGPLPMDSSL